MRQQRLSADLVEHLGALRLQPRPFARRHDDYRQLVVAFHAPLPELKFSFLIVVSQFAPLRLVVSQVSKGQDSRQKAAMNGVQSKCCDQWDHCHLALI